MFSKQDVGKIYASMSNVVHFRPKSVPRVEFSFTCGAQNILIVDKYTYLGITLNEFLDCSVTAKAVS